MTASSKPVHWSEPRAAWWADEAAVASIDFGLAITADDFEGAFRVLHDQYVWRRYMTPETGGRRVSLFNVLPWTKLFVAKTEGRVIGTVTIVEDSRMGLPMDEAFGPELGRLRERGRRLTEISSLALDANFRASGIPILVRLYRLAVIYAARVVRADHLCFLVHPRHSAFYRRLFPFMRFGGMTRYRRTRGAPAVALRLELNFVRALMRVQRWGLSAGPFTSFVWGPEACDEVLARLRRELPRSGLTPPEWARLFAGAGDWERVVVTPSAGAAVRLAPAGTQARCPNSADLADPSTLIAAVQLGAVNLEPGDRS